uniref:Uncharacterized protein n=1 Tax=Arundo donax TaxID=35708 RepID=A0A0A9DSY0_ARUDO
MHHTHFHLTDNCPFFQLFKSDRSFGKSAISTAIFFKCGYFKSYTWILLFSMHVFFFNWLHYSKSNLHAITSSQHVQSICIK